MSLQHAGYFIRRVDAEAISKVFELFREELGEGSGRSLRVAARAEVSVMHVMLTDEEDVLGGHGSSLFHREMPGMNECLAEELDTQVWAYVYDSRTDWEFIEGCDASGNFFEHLDSNYVFDAEGNGCPREQPLAEDQLPLSQLARRLEVQRSLLVGEFFYGRSGLYLAFDEELDEEAVSSFLASLPPPDGAPVEEAAATATFILPAALVAEAQATAAERGTTLSVVLHAAWEHGKHPLAAKTHRAEPAYGIPPEQVAASRPPPGFETPAGVTSPLELGPSSVRCSLAVPPSMVEEMRAFLEALDRPGSWLLREAYVLARQKHEA